MNVCFLINQLAPGGAPTLLLDIVANTKTTTAINYTVCFIEGDDSLVSDFEDEGARVVDFDAKFKFDPRALSRMAWFFQHEEFDILHTHLPYSQTLGRIFGRFGNVSHVVSTQHNVPGNYHPITGVLERVTRPLDSMTIAVSEGVEREFTGSAHQYEPGFQGQWCTIPNGLSVENFNTKIRNSDVTELHSQYENIDGPVFLNVSRYVPAKAQHDLIAAMRYVTKERPDAHLFVVGWGELEEKLRRQVIKYDLTENVTLTGRVPEKELYSYYALADLFVSSSVREGLPIAHLEAMAAELPVVATDIPGVREVVEHGTTGLLVPPNSPEQLANAILQSETGRTAFGEQSYDRAATQFDIHHTVESHVNLYHQIASKS